jgi:hypothetical protein
MKIEPGKRIQRSAFLVSTAVMQKIEATSSKESHGP